MVEATVALVREIGPERVTVREAARRAGVSSGAPFRHFPTKVALMTAVAEEAMRRLREAVAAALRRHAAAPPLLRFRAIGSAYLRWVIDNPGYFQVISDRRQIDFDGSAALREDNAVVQQVMEAQLRQAKRQGALRVSDIRRIALSGRALAYGLARMYTDGHLAQWGVAPQQAVRQMEAVLDQFLAGIATEPSSPPAPSPAPPRRAGTPAALRSAPGRPQRAAPGPGSPARRGRSGSR